MVRVRDLIQALQDTNGYHIVVLSSDAEGNSYSPLSFHQLASYDEETGELRDYLDEEGRCALVLYPEN